MIPQIALETSSLMAVSYQIIELSFHYLLAGLYNERDFQTRSESALEFKNLEF